MADEEKKSKKSTSKSKGKSKKSTKKSQKSSNGLKRPLSAYMLFCSKQREELKKKGDDKKLTAKELGAMWNKLSETKKKPFFDKFEAEKKKYEKLKDELENKSEEEDEEEEKEPKKKASKAKAKTKKSQNSKNNCNPCNCGECDYCKKKKKKGKKATADDEECKYKFGLDPVWMISNNELAFINSLKMKFSVIIGVFQMTLGIVLKGINSIYDKNLIECFCVFIPELIFHFSLDCPFH